MPSDFEWMGEALRLADVAAQKGEVPVGAVAVYRDEIVGRGYNCPITACDPSAHAEVMALREAALYVGNYRLPEVTLFVTLEPCVMCSGLIQHARLQRLVFGAHDPKTGACGSLMNLFENTSFNHHVHEVVSGVRAEESIERLQAFFRARRKKV